MASPEQAAALMGLTPPKGAAPASAPTGSVSASQAAQLMGLAHPSAPVKKKGRSHGFLSTIAHIPGDFLAGAEKAAVSSPAALAEIANASAKALLYLEGDKRGDVAPLAGVAKAYGLGVRDVAQHPLRDPFATTLTLLPLYGGAARGVLAGKAAAAAAKAGEGGVGRALIAKPSLGPRTITFEGNLGDTLTARGQYSRATGSAVTQRAVDNLLKRGAAKKPTGFSSNRLNARGAKWLERDIRVAESKDRLPGTTLQALGRTLTPAEVRALDIVAREVPVDRRIAAQQMRAGRKGIKPDEASRHQERIDLTRAAGEFIDHGPDGKPLLKDAKLQTVYDALVKASGSRGEILANLRLLDKGAQHAAVEKASRIAAGARFGSVDWETGAPFERSDQVMKAIGAHDLESGQSLRPDLYMQHPTSGYMVRNTTPRSVEINTPGQPPRIHDLVPDQHRFGEGEVPGSVRPPQYVFRAVSEEDYQAALKRGHLKSDGRMNLGSSEGTVASLRDPSWYLPGKLASDPHGTRLGRILRIDYRDEDGWKLDTDSYVKTPHEIPVDRISAAPQFAVTKGNVPSSITGNPIEHIDTVPTGVGLPPKGVYGADDISVSADAPFISTAVERSAITGQPRVSSRRTFGRTRKPGTLKASTGAALEHARERLDITNVVAEHQAEAVRLKSIDRRAKQAARSGKFVPVRKDDVWVWTDFTRHWKDHNLVSIDRIDPAVRKAIDDPDSLRDAPDEGRSVLQKLHKAAFSNEWKVSDAEKARFEEYAKKGEGVFVPRKLLGNAGKWNPNITGAQLGTRILDDINNAQKAALIYLKLNYIVVQSLSNAALNIVQGAANPIHITEAVRAYRANPVLASAVEDIIGQGAVVQAAFRGTGKVSGTTQKIAHAMSSKVDRPARLNAFAYEARKAGFGGDRMNELVFDPANADKLAEVAQRGKEAIIDYSELSPAESALVRRILFVYPWQKGAFKYAGDFLRDHPIQAAALAYLGNRGQEINDEKLGPVSSYLKGAFDVGGGLVNPAGVNVLQTPQQQGAALVSAFSARPGPTGVSFLSPVLGFGVSQLTGRDDFGRPLPGNPLTGFRNEFVSGIPAVQVLRALTASRSDAARKILGPEPGSKSFPNPNDTIWRWLIGGLYPRDYNKPALNRNAALEKSGR